MSSNVRAVRTADYKPFCVITESEWKLSSDDGSRIITMSTVLNGLSWEVIFTNNHIITLKCREARSGQLVQQGLYLEVFFYGRNTEQEGFSEILLERHITDYGQNTSYIKDVQVIRDFPVRIYLNEDAACWDAYFYKNKHYKSILLTVRLLKNRVLFPDLIERTSLGHLPYNVELRVGQKTFHANKQLLSTSSRNFHAMFFENFPEKDKDVVELTTDMVRNVDPEIYHIFLLMLCQPSADLLPNASNVESLLFLADFYNCNWLTERCIRQLKYAREMPRLKRLQLVQKYDKGNKELLLSILQEIAPVLGGFEEIVMKLIDLADTEADWTC